MAKNVTRPVPGGQATHGVPAFSPTTAGGAPVLPGRQPDVNEFDQLRQALLGAGQVAAGVFQARGQAQRQTRALKDRAIREHEKEVALAARAGHHRQRSIMQDRLATVDAERRSLLQKAGDHPPEWLLRESSLRAENAATPQERQLWQEVVGEVQQHVQAREDALERQDISRASHTASQAVMALTTQLNSDPELQAELIGDGRDIHQRVQDWILSEAEASAPALFDLDEDDPHFIDKDKERLRLTANLVEQSFRVGDNLLKQHQHQTREAAEATGFTQITADIQSFLDWDMSIDTFLSDMELTASRFFSHLTDRQAEQQWREIAADQAVAAAATASDKSMTVIAERVETLIKSGGFSPDQEVRLRQSVRQSTEQSMLRGFDDRAVRLQDSFMSRTLNPDGSASSKPHPRAELMMATPDPETRVSPVRAEAMDYLAEHGLDRPTDALTDSEVQVRQAVLGRVQELEDHAARALAATEEEEDHRELVARGRTDGDPDKAYAGGTWKQSRSSVPDLPPDRLRRMKQDARLVIQDMVAIQPEFDAQAALAALDEWDGSSQIPYTEATRPLRAVAANHEAVYWARSDTAAEHGLPTSLVEDVRKLATSGDPERVLDAVTFASRLHAENTHQHKRLLDAMPDNEQAAMIWAISDQRIPGEFQDRRGPDTLARRFSEIVNDDRSNDEFFRSHSFAAGDGHNTEVFLRSMAKHLAAEGASSIPRRPHRAELSELHAGIETAFVHRSGPAVEQMKLLWRGVVAAEPGLDPEIAAARAISLYRGAGLRMHNIQGQARFVKDPVGHLGVEDPRHGEVQNRLQQLSHTPFTPERQDIVVRAMGWSADDAPEGMHPAPRNLQEVFHWANPTTLLEDDLTIIMGDGLGDTSAETMLKDHRLLGGMFVSARTAQGLDLDPVTSNNPVDVTLQDENGEDITVTLPPGTPISVISTLGGQEPVAPARRTLRDFGFREGHPIVGTP